MAWRKHDLTKEANKGELTILAATAIGACCMQLMAETDSNEARQEIQRIGLVGIQEIVSRNAAER